MWKVTPRSESEWEGRLDLEGRKAFGYIKRVRFWSCFFRLWSVIPLDFLRGTWNFSTVGGAVVKNPPRDTRDVGLILGSRRPPGVGNGNPLQYSCLGNPMDRKAWQATVRGITESDMTEYLNRIILASICWAPTVLCISRHCLIIRTTPWGGF